MSVRYDLVLMAWDRALTLALTGTDIFDSFMSWTDWVDAWYGQGVSFSYLPTIPYRLSN